MKFTIPHAQFKATLRHIVHFKDVGAQKMSWDLPIDGPVNPEALYRSLKKKGALGSRGIDFDVADDGASGTIIVGGFRPVGTFTVEVVQ